MFLKKVILLRNMRKLLLIFLISGFFYGCLKDEEVEVFYPEDYFPAYPASYWIYNNGNTVKVDPGYHLHSYEDSVESNNKTEDFYVPRIDEHYVYGYKITQNSTRVPVKQLLSEKDESEWVVEYWNGKPIKRKTVSITDVVTLQDTVFGIDTTISGVIAVIEYSEEMGEENWFVKEYYAKYVGLIRTEINNYPDTLNPIIGYDLVDYYINHNFGL